MTNTYRVLIPDTTIGLGAVNSIGNIAKGFAPAKTLLVTDATLMNIGVVDNVKGSLEKVGLNVDIFHGCVESPTVSVVEKLIQNVREKEYDLIIGIGGGSNMDTAKAAATLAFSDMSLRDFISKPFHEKIGGRLIPKIMVPTTAGTGAEWSQVTNIHDDDHSGMHVVMAVENLPNNVIIDPELTITVPQKVTADTGFDALTHAIESYTCATANLFSDMLSGTAIRLVAENIRQAYSKGSQNIEARCNMSFAAALAMNAVICGGIGLAHFMHETLAPKANISHGSSLAILLPAVMEYNMIANPAKFAKVAELMGENISGLSELDAAAKSVEAVRRLRRDLGLPQTMSEVGITEDDIDELAKRCYDINQGVIVTWNPRDATAEEVAQIFRLSL